MITKVYLHGDKGTAVEQAQEIAGMLGIERYSREYDKLYQAVFFNELEVEVEIDPETLESRIVSVKPIL